MICPCCGAETPDKNILDTLWKYDSFITWFKNHISQSDYKKYDIEHYHGRVKLKCSELKNFKEILSKIILFIDCDVNSNGKFPVKYAKEEKVDIGVIAFNFVAEHKIAIGLCQTAGLERDAIEIIGWLKEDEGNKSLPYWNHPSFEMHVERALKHYKLAD